MCKSRENKQESLPTKIHGKDALLQSCKGRHWQRIVAYFCHDETLIELRSQQCAIDDHVVRCQADQRAKALKESGNHVDQVWISTRKTIQQ